MAEIATQNPKDFAVNTGLNLLISFLEKPDVVIGCSYYIQIFTYLNSYTREHHTIQLITQLLNAFVAQEKEYEADIADFVLFCEESTKEQTSNIELIFAKILRENLELIETHVKFVLHNTYREICQQMLEFQRFFDLIANSPILQSQFDNYTEVWQIMKKMGQNIPYDPTLTPIEVQKSRVFKPIVLNQNPLHTVNDADQNIKRFRR